MKLFLKATQQILSNWKMTLRMSVGLIGIITLSAVASFLGIEVFANAYVNDQKTFIIALLIIVLTLIAIWVVLCSVAVSWHRYILRDELPSGWIMPGKEGLTLDYWLGTLKIGIITIVIAIGLSLILAFTAGAFTAFPTSVLVFVGAATTIILNALIIIFITRISITLPALALENPMSFSEAFEKTKILTGEILVVAILMAIGSLILQSLPAILFMMPAIPETIFTVANIVFTVLAYWFSTFLGIGILTVIYGHVVESKEL